VDELAQRRGVLEALRRERVPGARAEQPRGRDEAGGRREAVLANQARPASMRRVASRSDRAQNSPSPRV
jgi:hypothetical protein